MEEALMLKALSHATRLGIVRLLLQRSMCVRALARHFGVSEPTVSVHLRVLRRTGLLYGEKKRYSMHYHVRREKLRELAAFFGELSALPELPRTGCGGHGRCRCRCHEEEKSSV